MLKRIRHPSPAMVVALIALFFALGGAAGAVTAVPLAKRALNADNAKKLSGKTLAQVTEQAAALPSPSALTTKTLALTLGPQVEGYSTIACDAGQQAISGGYSTPAAVLALDSYPADQLTWRTYLVNLTSGSAPVTLFVTCAVPAESNNTFGRAQPANPASKGALELLEK
jgi:hypothetical protein